MRLRDQLDALRADRLGHSPREVVMVRARAVEQLDSSGLAELAIQAGDRGPSFRLRDGGGIAFSSLHALRSGPLLMVFYRGRWCPYCNLELRAIQSASPDIRALGARIVAVSQQTSDESLRTERLNALSFPSLVDRGGRVARAFGLRWKVPDELRAVEKRCDADLAVFNGEPSWTLTMPARYIVATDGTVEYADISIDHTRRGDPSDLFPVLSQLAGRAAH
jgi:peroxiredoxin